MVFQTIKKRKCSQRNDALFQQGTDEIGDQHCCLLSFVGGWGGEGPPALTLSSLLQGQLLGVQILKTADMHSITWQRVVELVMEMT